MSKKSLLLGASLLAAAVVSQPAEAHFNVGLKGGYSHGFNKVNSFPGESTAFVGGTDVNNNTDLGIRGALGGIVLGWGMPFANDKFYAGVEAGFDISSTSGRDCRMIRTNIIAPGDSFRNDIELKRKYGFDFSAKFGTYIESVLAYLKLGFGITKYELKSRLFTEGVAGLASVDQTSTFSKYFVSFKPAIGFDVPVSNCMSVGIEYSHEFNKAKSFTQNYDPQGAIPTQQHPHSVKPSTGAVVLTVNYKFGQGVA